MVRPEAVAALLVMALSVEPVQVAALATGTGSVDLLGLAVALDMEKIPFQARRQEDETATGMVMAAGDGLGDGLGRDGCGAGCGCGNGCGSRGWLGLWIGLGLKRLRFGRLWRAWAIC